MGKRVLLGSLAVLLIACSSPAAEEETEPSPVPTTEPTTRPAPTTETPEASTPKPTSDAGACTLGPVVSYPVGDQCGFDAAGTVQCPGEARFDGFVYVCKDNGTSPTRPAIAGCHAYTRSDGLTRVICPEVRCTPFEDSRCGSRAAYACPTSKPGAPAAPSPGANCEATGASWSLGLGPFMVGGPLVCCG